MKNKAINILTVVLIFFFSFSCTEVTVIEDSDCLAEEFVKSLTFHTADYDYVEDIIRVPGKVSYNANNVVRYVPLISGVVVNMNFTLGDYVNKGQTLAEIQSSELLDISNSLKIAKSQLEILNRNYKIVKRQFNDGFASSRDLFEAEKEREMIKNEIIKYESKMELYGGNVNTGRFRLKAPASGNIVDNNMSVGMQIYPESEPIFTVSNLDEVWVIANIYSGLIANIRTGMKARVYTTAYRDTVFTGNITHVSNIFDANRRVLQAIISLSNKELLLKPEMFVDIFIHKENKKNKAIYVPVKAVVFENNQKHVIVYDDECNFEVRKIEKLVKKSDRIYLKSGVEKGEKIVVENALYLFHEVM